MKLQVTKENLSRALSITAKIASTKSTLPILANVAFKTNKNRLSVSATNLDIAITCLIGAKITQDGSTTIPARLVQDFISNLPEGVIDIKQKDNKLNITTDQYQSTINSVSAEDFPHMPSITGKTLKISAQQLQHTLSRVVGAASNDETRPVLTGVYLQSDSKLIVAATDSYRLAEEVINDKIKLDPIIIPANAVNELLRIIPDEGDIQITYNEQQICFSTDDIELTARLIDGKYPPYQNLIPKNFKTSAVLKRTDLLNITKVSSLFAKESAGSITVNVDETDNLVSIHSIASQLGENTANATGEVNGSGSITLNSRYLLDALNTLSESEYVYFGFNGKLEPIIIKDSKKNDFTYVIMPLKS